MKKILMLCLVLAVLLSSPSCSSQGGKTESSTPNFYPEDSYEENVPEYFDGGYMYYIGSDRLVTNIGIFTLTTLWRYDIAQNKSEPACRDAACSHKPGSGCPFEAASLQSSDIFGTIPAFSVRNGIVYYITYEVNAGKIDRDAKSILCSYNTKTYEYKVLANYERFEPYVFLQVYEDALYYVQQIAHENDTGVDNWLYRYSFKQGKSERLFAFDNGSTGSTQGILPFGMYGDRALFYRYKMRTETADTEVQFVAYPLKKDAQEQQVGASICFESFPVNFEKSGNSIFYAKQDSVLRSTIYRMDLVTGTVEVYVTDAAVGERISGNTLYYFPYEPTFMTVGGETISNVSVGKIIAKDLDTGEERVYQSQYAFNFSAGYNASNYYQGKLFSSVQVASEGLYKEYGWYVDIIYDLENDSYTVSPK